MINIKTVSNQFKKFISQFDNQDVLGFQLKLVHTYRVVENAKLIAQKLNLSEEDIDLAMTIAYLHDIGRFDELFKFNGFNSVDNDHAKTGVDFLFKDKLIRNFIEDSEYDEIIKTSIFNHNKINIENGLDKRTEMHCKIIRDADKLDNYRVKKEEKIEAIFPNILNCKEDMENSTISDSVYETVKKGKCVDIHDRKTVLDYWICVLAFTFDINYRQTMEIIKDNNYINILIDRFGVRILIRTRNFTQCDII